MASSANNFSTRQLRAFLALVDTRSFTRAAEAVHLSQPAFSALIRTLEDALGARLFDRDTRSVQPTAEGHLLEESARRLIADMESVLANFQDHVVRRKGRVSVAALPSLAAGWLATVFGEFRLRYPGIELHLADTLSENCVELVRAGKVDFALAATDTGTADLTAQALCTDRFYVVCRKDSPLAREKEIKPRQLVHYPFVHLSRSSSVRQHLDAMFHPLKMSTVLEVEHLATVMGMVEKGIGISVIPALALFHFEKEALVIRPLCAKGITRTIYLIRRSGESLSVAAQALYDLALERRPLFEQRSRARTR